MPTEKIPGELQSMLEQGLGVIKEVTCGVCRRAKCICGRGATMQHRLAEIQGPTSSQGAGAEEEEE